MLGHHGRRVHVVARVRALEPAAVVVDDGTAVHRLLVPAEVAAPPAGSLVYLEAEPDLAHNLVLRFRFSLSFLAG